MEQVEKRNKHKGGRPKKAIRKTVSITVKCTPFDKQAIQLRAKMLSLTPSEYLLQLGINGQIDMRQRKFPKEVLELKALLNHLAANVNQIAKKRNSNEVLGAVERANLFTLESQVKEVVSLIKNYLQ